MTMTFRELFRTVSFQVFFLCMLLFSVSVKARSSSQLHIRQLYFLGVYFWVFASFFPWRWRTAVLKYVDLVLLCSRMGHFLLVLLLENCYIVLK